MEKELDYPNNQINYEINDFFYISEFYENDENINSENVDNLIESFSDFNSFSEDIFNEEPIPAKIEYIYENNYDLDLDENIIDELYNQINGNLESLNIIIKKIRNIIIIIIIILKKIIKRLKKEKKILIIRIKYIIKSKMK